MNNPFSNLKPTLAVQSAPVYSSALVLSGIAPVTSLTISELPEKDVTLRVNMTCQYGKNTYFFYSSEGEDSLPFSTACYDTGSVQNALVFRFDLADFTIDYEAFSAIETQIAAEIRISVLINGKTTELSLPIKLVPVSEWQGIEEYPESLAAYICPQSKTVAEITKDIPSVCAEHTKAERIDIARALFSCLREKNMICAARDSYSPERRQNIKLPDDLISKSAVVASPLELALLFSACAERIGLAPVILFTTNLAGTVGVLCGFRMSGYGFHTVKTPALTESLSGVRELVVNDELFVFDPAVLSSAQSMDIALAVTAAAENLKKASVKLLLAYDVTALRAMGVRPLYRTNEHVYDNKASSGTPRAVLGAMYTGLMGNRAFELLNGGYTGFDVIPLLGSAKNLIKSSKDKRHTLRPMEISERPQGFAGLADDFAAFALKDEKINAYNKAELESVSMSYASFKHRISEKNYAVAGIYEKYFHDRMNRMTFGDLSHAKNYLACGFMRLVSHDGEIRYLPTVLQECTLDRHFDYTFALNDTVPVINTLLVTYLSDKKRELVSIDTIEKATVFFEELAKHPIQAAGEEFSEITLLDEAALIRADLSDFRLWDDLREYGKTMLLNPNFADILTEEGAKSAPEFAKDCVLVKDLPESAKKAVLCRENSVITGDSADGKTDVAVSRMADALTKGENMLVSSEDDAFLTDFAERIRKLGLEEAVLDLRSVKTPDLIARTVALVKRLEKVERVGASVNYDGELIENTEKLKAYVSALKNTDPVLGISLGELIESYENASLPLGDMALLDVPEEVYTLASTNALNELFDLAESLVVSSKSAMRAVGFSETAPLSTHPLSLVKRTLPLSDDDLRKVSDLVWRIVSALSEYRETFFEVSEALDISIRDIQTLDAAHALNTLYKIAISLRELDLSDKLPISGGGLFDFADTAEKKNTAKRRMENIEYKLRFFSPEAFEDVESILSGNGEKSEDSGFLKKFLVKRNQKDVLLQYVPASGKSEFARYDVTEIYKLLEEYYHLKKGLSGDESADENAIIAASFIKSIKQCLSVIYPHLAQEEDQTALDRKTLTLFRFAETLSNDPALSKKITYARARFAGVYSENECLIKELASILNADFESLTFEDGILDYDGISAYLKTLSDHLPAFEAWISFLQAERTASGVLDSFIAFLYEKGNPSFTDRLFAASLLRPAATYLVKKYELDKEYPAYIRARDSYAALTDKCKSIAQKAALDAYLKRTKHYLETENVLVSFEKDETLSIYAFVRKHKKHLVHLYPCILAGCAEAVRLFDGEMLFDTVLLKENGTRSALAPVALAKRTMLVCYREGGAVCEKLFGAGAYHADLSYHAMPASGSAMFAASETGAVFAPLKPHPLPQVVTVNGACRFSGDAANPAEAEAGVAKAIELVQKTGGKTFIFAFTSGECAYLRHLLCLEAERRGEVYGFVCDGRIAVKDATRFCFEECENAVVCFGAAPDKEGNTPKTLAFLGTPDAFRRSLLNIAYAYCGELVFVLSSSLKELSALCRHERVSPELFLLSLYAHTGVVPTRLKENETVSVFTKKRLANTTGVLLAKGIYRNGADLVCVNENTAYLADHTDDIPLFDRLFLAKKLANAGITPILTSPLDALL